MNFDKISKAIISKLKSGLKRDYEENYEITYIQLIEMLKSYNVILIDVRSAQEFNEGHLNGAINMPLSELKTMADTILKDYNDIIVAYCQVGSRSKKAVNLLRKIGYVNVFSLEGGLDAI